MNKIITNTLFMIIAVIVFAVLGNLILLSSLNIELKEKNKNLENKQKELKSLKDSFDSVASDSYKIRENILLNIGQEGQLMSLFINEGLNKVFSIKSYDLYTTYYFKPDNFEDDIEVNTSKANQKSNLKNDNNGQEDKENKVSQSNVVNLPELDENGMPKDAYVDNGDEDNWEGINILGVKITFSIKKDNLSRIIRYFQQFPVNTVRAADFIFCDNNLVNGTLIFAFPLNEEKN